MKKLLIGLAALSVAAGAYVAAEVVYQKRKASKTLHMGNQNDFKDYQKRFMEIEGKPVMPIQYYSEDSTFAEHIISSIRENTQIQKYKDAEKESAADNMLFGTFHGQEFGLSLNSLKTCRSNNVLTIGCGSSTDRNNYIKANIMQENASALVVDPNGSLYHSLAPHLCSKGYNVFLFSLSCPQISHHYNPLMYLHDENGDILETQVDMLVDVFFRTRRFKNEDEDLLYGTSEKAFDPFYESAERNLLKALIYYILENDNIPARDKCFSTILKKVQMLYSENDDCDCNESPLTKEIYTWAEENMATCKTKPYYDSFMIAPAKTQRGIVCRLIVDLQIFATEEFDIITRTDIQHPDMNIDFYKLFLQQGYLFVDVPLSHKAFDFLFSALYAQFYSTAYRVGEKTCRGKYHIGYRRGLPVFDPFNSEEDAKAFLSNVTYENIVEQESADSGSKVYSLIWGNGDELGPHEYKTCTNRKALESDIQGLDKMVIWAGDDVASGNPALPIHVNVFLKDFANCGYIPNFSKILITSRPYCIGSHCMVNTIEELKKMYPNNEYETILANVDSIIYFGSSNQPAADVKWMQEVLGYTVGERKSKEYLMSLKEIDAIGSLDADGKRDTREIVSIRDVLPFICQKLDPRK